MKNGGKSPDGSETGRDQLSSYYGPIDLTTSDHVVAAGGRPLRGLRAGVGGAVLVTLWRDFDPETPNDQSKVCTLYLSAKETETQFAIAKVWRNGTTATGLEGWT